MRYSIICSANTRARRLAALLAQVLLSVALVLSLPSAQAALEGDVELLKLTAMAHKDNTERIRTWQGSAHIEVTRVDEKGMVLVEKNAATFLYDREQEATRWRYIVQERRRRRDDKLIDEQGWTVNAMRKDDGYYRYEPGETTREGERRNTLVIWPRPKAEDDVPYSYAFDPMWYLTNKGTDLTERLDFYYREAHNPELSDGTVERKGDRVILETRRETGTELKTLINRYEFDLSQGGNLVRYYGETAQGTEQRDWTYQQRGQVWVPASFELRIEKRGVGKRLLKRTMKVNFTENIVNRPIDPSEFSLEGLGVSYGDLVSDQRMGIAYRYGADETFQAEELEKMVEEMAEELPIEEPEVTPAAEEEKSVISREDEPPVTAPTVAQTTPPSSKRTIYIITGLAALVLLLAIVFLILRRKAVVRNRDE